MVCDSDEAAKGVACWSLPGASCSGTDDSSAATDSGATAGKFGGTRGATGKYLFLADISVAGKLRRASNRNEGR